MLLPASHRVVGLELVSFFFLCSFFLGVTFAQWILCKQIYCGNLGVNLFMQGPLRGAEPLLLITQIEKRAPHTTLPKPQPFLFPHTFSSHTLSLPSHFLLRQPRFDHGSQHSAGFEVSLPPPELRNQIYKLTLNVNDRGGYTFDLAKGKLRVADNGQPINLSLMYTCRQIASETAGLPLRLNTITFSTSTPLSYEQRWAASTPLRDQSVAVAAGCWTTPARAWTVGRWMSWSADILRPS